MNRLCKSKDSKLEGVEHLPNPDDTRKRALEVGTKADSQAADLLEACAPQLEQHFKSIGQCARRTPRKIMERNWRIEIKIWPKYKKTPASAKMTAGVSIQRLDKPQIIPWIWRRGGVEAEKMLEHILANRAEVRSQDAGWSPGSVGLKRICVLPDNLDGFDVDCEPLIDQVQQAFRVFGPQDLDALWPK